MTKLRPKGIIPPIITPMTPDGRINKPVLATIIDRLIADGVHGIFPFGTTGEFYAFSSEEYEDGLRFVVEQVGGRVPVYAGANHITTRGAAELVRIAESTGVDAVSVLTPMFISQTQEELYRFFETLAVENPASNIIMYNNRPKTNVHIEPATIQRLAQIDNIVGVKDSTGDMTNTMEYIRLTADNPNFSVLVGRDTLIFPGLCCGAVGAISSCSNVATKITVDIYEKFIRGDLTGALQNQFTLAPLRLACNMGTFPQVIKEGLEILGVQVGNCVEPIHALSAEEHSKLTQVLRGMQLIG